MTATRPRQSSSFMQISESEHVTSPAFSLKHYADGLGKRWGRRILLKRQDSPVIKAKSTKSHSFIKNFRYSFNAKFTILSLVLLALFMSGSTAAAPVDEEASSTTTTSASPTSSGSSATTSDITTGGTVSVPTLFDTVSISSNTTTTSCPLFFSTFLTDPEFLNCLPLSALVQNSQSFFQIAKQGAFPLTQVVDKTCNVNVNKCLAVMEKLGWQITLDENCGADYKLGNPIVNSAYAAFVSYRPVYTAGCLKSATGSYCYVDAMTNDTSPNDAYIYYLPLGISLPGGSRPTCSSCLSKTMAIFAASAGNGTQPLSNTYVQAAEQINFACGPNFSNSTVEIQEVSAAWKAHLPASLLLLALLLAIGAIIAI